MIEAAVRHMRSAHLLVFLLGLSVAGPTEARDVTQYDYLAYSGGLSAGVAVVRVTRDQDAFEIHGEAEASGFLGWLSRWRSRFEVVGRLEAGELVVESYKHMEANRSRVKEVEVEHGTIRYVRNGELRAPRDAVAPVDVFSLMFVGGECKQTFRAHSGLMGYDLRLAERGIEGEVEKCIYSAVDDEGDRFEAEVWVETVEGARVPTRLDIEGYALGVFELDQALVMSSNIESQDELAEGVREE